MKKKIGLWLLLLLLAVQAGAAVVNSLPELDRPNFIQVDGDELFVTDGYSIYIYSLQPLALKTKFGQKGEGPGEFTTWPFVRVAKDFILCTTLTRCLWFTRNGKLNHEKRLQDLFMLMPARENYIALELETDMKTRTVFYKLQLINPDFKEIKMLYKTASDSPLVLDTDSGAEEHKMLYHYFDFLSYKDKIFVADSHKGLFIEVFDTQGNHLYSIRYPVEKVKVTPDYRKKAMDLFKIVCKNIYETKKKSSFTFYDYFPPMKHFWIDDNKIYITTYRQENNKNELLVLDLKGKLLKRLFLPFKSMQDWRILGAVDPYTFHQGILYELVENQETSLWELHKTNLSTFFP